MKVQKDKTFTHKAEVKALVIDDGVYEPGVQMSDVPQRVKKHFRTFMEKEGPRFLAEHASVGGVRKGRGWVYHLKPKRGKTVLDIASEIDSVQNEKGPSPSTFEYAGVQYVPMLFPAPP